MGSPINMSDTPVCEPTAPPTLGQHTDAVLGEVLGMETTEIARLHAAGVVV
jgi:crotonobetainyl-CoA:carnitine CoA-transferase CaiB-like acyl-CoA transferase